MAETAGNIVKAEPSISQLANQKNIDDANYAKLLDIYVKESKKQEQLDKERQRQFLMEKAFSYSWVDLFFPYHMYLGYLENLNNTMIKPEKTVTNTESDLVDDGSDF